MGQRDKLFERLDRLDYKGKSELVYDEIRRAIMEGILEPGNKLDIDQFAAAMRVSRMPVREAVKRLQVEADADIVLLDKSLKVKDVFLRGKRIDFAR